MDEPCHLCGQDMKAMIDTGRLGPIVGGEFCIAGGTLVVHELPVVLHGDVPYGARVECCHIVEAPGAAGPVIRFVEDDSDSDGGGEPEPDEAPREVEILNRQKFSITVEIDGSPRTIAPWATETITIER